MTFPLLPNDDRNPPDAPARYVAAVPSANAGEETVRGRTKNGAPLRIPKQFSAVLAGISSRCIGFPYQRACHSQIRPEAAVPVSRDPVSAYQLLDSRVVFSEKPNQSRLFVKLRQENLRFLVLNERKLSA